MKKIIAIALGAVMIFALTACGGGKDNNQQTNSQTTQTTEKQNQSAKSGSVLDICGLTEDDIKTSVGKSLGEVMDGASKYDAPVHCADTNYETFKAWINELADNCRKAAKDGNLYQSELDDFALTAEFDPGDSGLMNMVQFVYRTDGHVNYVTLSDTGTEDGAFLCSIQVYQD